MTGRDVVNAVVAWVKESQPHLLVAVFAIGALTGWLLPKIVRLLATIAG